MHDMVFFFSYARQDADMANDCFLEKFYKDLDSRIGGRLAKSSPCSYKDTDMDTGTVWPEAHKQALLKCPLIVFFLSPYYQHSNFGGKELAVYLERREYMEKKFPQLPNLIFPVRWIPLQNSGLPEPDSVKRLNSNNYKMTGNIMKDGLRKLIELDPKNYNKFMNGMVDAMLDALHILENRIPDYLSKIPPIPDIMTIPSAFSTASSQSGTIHESTSEPTLSKPGSNAPPKPGAASRSGSWLSVFKANTKSAKWGWSVAGSVLIGLAGMMFFSNGSNSLNSTHTSPDSRRYNKEFHWLNNEASLTKTEMSSEIPEASTQELFDSGVESTFGKIKASVFKPMSEYVFGQPLTIVTGAPKKSFSKIFADINSVCGEAIPLKELYTTGGLDNLGELASKGAYLGLVGIDVFQAMEETDDAIGRLKAVMSLNTDLLHILVLKSGYKVETHRQCTGKEVDGKCIGGVWESIYQWKVIEKDTDLTGLTVAAVGGAQVVARRYLNSSLKLGLNIVDIDTDSEAQAELKAGKVQAVLTLAAFPSGPIWALNQSDGFALANWESGASGSYKTTKKNYKNIGSFGTTFLSTQIILMARPVDPNGEIGRKITQLKACITAHLGKLKEGEEFEASWPDVVNVSVPKGIPAWE